MGIAYREREPGKTVRKKLCIESFALALAFLWTASPAFAQTVWVDDIGEWFDSDNWSAGVPNSAIDAQINNGGTAQIAPSVDASAQNVILGLGSSDSGTLVAFGSLGSSGTTVGSAGTGMLEILNTRATNNVCVIGELAGSNGTARVAAANWDNSGDLIIGQSGTGTLTIADSGVTNVKGIVGKSVGATGTVNVVAQSAWINSDTLSVGGSGTGSLNIDDGVVSNTVGFIGEFAGSNGTVALNNAASQWQNSGNLYVGGNASGAGGTGLLRIKDGGTVTAATTVVWKTGVMEIGVNPIVNGGLTFAGGTLRTIANTTFSKDATFSSAGATTFDSNGFNSTLSGVFSGAGVLTKIGAGSIVLTNASSYTGPTTVNAGELIVNGSITSAVTVNGGTLGGSGTTGEVTVNSSGVLSPGASPGILNVAGNLTLVMGSIYLVDLDGAAVGTEYDQTKVDGLVGLGNATLSLDLGFSPADETNFTIILNDGADAVTGTFNGLSEGTIFTAGGEQFAISYEGGDGNDVVLTSMVPEPGTWVLLVVGAATLIASSRRRRD